MATVAVIGGGNIGTLMAAEFARRGNEVRVCTSNTSVWSREIVVYDADESQLFAGRLALVTDELARTVDGAQWIFITYPSSLLSDLSARLTVLLKEGQRLVVVPGADAEFFFLDAIGAGVELYGLQRVHSIARLKERGKSVYQLGRKPLLQLASIPSGMAESVAYEVACLFGMPVETLPNYMVETLTPSNPILHTTRLATMFSSWSEGVAYPDNILFYEEWNNASSRCLIACDEELQAVCRVAERKLNVDLTGVVPLTQYYESPDAESMTRKISGIPAFRGLTSPMRQLEDGLWAPDFTSRYFTADFAVGLRAIVDLSDVLGVNTPHIDSVLAWYEQMGGERRERFVPNDLEGLRALYLA